MTLRQFMRLTKKNLIIGLVLVLLIAGGAFYSMSILGKKPTSTQFGAVSPTPIPDKYLAFSYEVWDKIKDNFWDKISDEDLAKLFKLGTDKISGTIGLTEIKTKIDVGNLIAESIKDKSDDKKIEFVTQLADVVLANLKPFGRSRLYTAKQQQALQNTVQNVDKSTDLYATLGLTKDATSNQIKSSYEKKSAELKKDKSPEAVKQLALIQRAYDALSSSTQKTTYDKSGIEPTVVSKSLTPDIFYIKLSKFSPQSFDEFKKAADSIDPKKKNGPTALIFDLRGNIGGAIDILQYFLGPFIGPNNYAYDFFHQGETKPYKTLYGWFDSLVRYKKIVTLIDEKDQSSAEVMAATLKKYNVGVLVGTTTKGWGTVEQVMQLNNQLNDSEKYSVFLVHSVTLREDGQPIESRGVEPTISIKDKDWPQQLMAYYNYQPLVDEVKKLINN